MLSVTVTGIGEIQTWLTKVEAGLEEVPERFSERLDVMLKLEVIARGTLLEKNINDEGTALENIRSESTPDNKGIMVYEDLNAATEATWGKEKGQNPYLMFFLTQYAPSSFLRPKGKAAIGRDFFALWPDRMRSTVVDAFEEEVRKALRT